MQPQSYSQLFKDEQISEAFAFRRQKSSGKGDDCAHTFVEDTSLDTSGHERICTKCGTLAQTEIDEGTKLAGCLDLEQWQDVPYGPPTPVFLQSFLVPTLRRIKCRDRYVDIKILAKLRTYTAIQRVCSRFSIPQSFADEAMRILLKRGKGLYSKYAYVKILIELIEKGDPRLRSRIPLLEPLSAAPRREYQKNEKGSHEAIMVHLKKHADLKGQIKKLDSDCRYCRKYFKNELAKIKPIMTPHVNKKAGRPGKSLLEVPAVVQPS